MIKYLITHGCEAKDTYCPCRTEIQGETIGEIIRQIDAIEEVHPVYKIEKLVEPADSVQIVSIPVRAKKGVSL